MARRVIDPTAYGVGLDREEFVGRLVIELDEFGRGALSVDELLLRPRTAIQFCDGVRLRHGWFDLPDEVILRAILTRRKHPSGRP